MAFDQLDEAASREKPEVGRIEDSSLVIVEHSQGRPESRIPVCDVRYAEKSGPGGNQCVPHLADEIPRIDDVLEDVRRQDDVEPATDVRRYSLVEVSLEELVRSIPHPVDLVHVNADHIVTHAPQPFGQQAARTTEIEDPARRPALQGLRYPTV